MQAFIIQNIFTYLSVEQNKIFWVWTGFPIFTKIWIKYSSKLTKVNASIHSNLICKSCNSLVQNYFLIKNHLGVAELEYTQYQNILLTNI